GGMNWSSLIAVGSIMFCGILFPGNAQKVAVVTPLTVQVCANGTRRPLTRLNCWKIVDGPVELRLNWLAMFVGNQPLLVLTRLVKSPERSAADGNNVVTDRKSCLHRGS